MPAAVSPRRSFRACWVAAGLLIALLVSFAPPLAAEEAADILLLRGRVWTAEANPAWAEAIAVRGGRVVAVGTTSEVETLRGPRTEVIHLGGRLVLPGFDDAHVHLVDGSHKPRQGRPRRAAGRSPDPGPDQGVGARSSARALDRGRRLGLRLVPRRPAHAPAARRRGFRSPRLHRVVRRPHRLGQLSRPRPGRDHERNPGPRGRRDRARPEDRRADRGAEGEAGGRSGEAQGPGARPRRALPEPAQGTPPAELARDHVGAGRGAALAGGGRGSRPRDARPGAARGKAQRAGRGGDPPGAGQGRGHRRPGQEARGPLSRRHAPRGRGQALRGRGRRVEDRGDARALCRRHEPRAPPTGPARP